METQVKVGEHRVTIRHPEGTVLRREGKTLVADPQRPEDVRFRQELQAEGIQWGDAIAWVTSKMGIRQCPPCHARQEILNHARQLGWKEAIRQIKETLSV